jgi:hypothetical protein
MPGSEAETEPTGVLIKHAIGKRTEAVAITLGPLAASDGPVPEEYISLYASITPDTYFPDDTIMVADSQFARLVGTPLSVLYNANSTDPTNMRASRLTTDLKTGKFTKICGNALVISGKAGVTAVSKGQVDELDNAVHDELLEYFCQGVAPTAEDLARIVREYKEGLYRYEVFKDGAGSGKAEDDAAREGVGSGDQTSDAAIRKDDSMAKDAKDAEDAEEAKEAKEAEEALPGWG